jgi:adenosylcobinamide-phosphate guanylyltransferase
MIGLVMAGGKGTRMNVLGEKLLLEYKKPIILHVVDALKESKSFSKIMAATSEHSPNTNDLLLNNGIEIIKTTGDGYVHDLNFALSGINEPTFVVSGDLPLLDASIVKELVARHKKDAIWQSFLVTKKFLDTLNIKLEFAINFDDRECYYTGISIVNPKKISHNQVEETWTIFDDKRIALNLNTKNDYDLLKGS